jgi:hypothetical protein
MQKKLLCAFLGLIAVLCLAGSRTFFLVDVNSINNPDTTRGMKYVLISGMQDPGVVDLQFNEFAAYVSAALRRSGHQEVKMAEDADVVIFLTYGIGEPKTHQTTYVMPVFDWSGGGTSHFTANTYGPHGHSTTTGTIQHDPEPVVRSQPVTGNYTTYDRFFMLAAFDLERYKRENALVPVWQTTVTSTGSSGDLRRVFPIMVAAAESYIGTNTGQKVRVKLTEKDARVKVVKGQ